MREETQKLESELAQQKYEVEVAEAISIALGEINGRDIANTTRHLEQIKKALESEIDGSLDLLFGGSVAKHTHVDGLSDVDTLVILNKSELSDKPPDDVQSYFAELLRSKLPGCSVTAGRLAVTVVKDGDEIQLLPALREKDGLKIPSGVAARWSRVRPEAFTEDLTKANQESGGKIVPMIKLAKSIISQLPDQFQLSGYHVEALAVKAFRGYKGPMTTKAYLHEFFRRAPNLLQNPIPDVTGRSDYIDKYLGAAGGPERIAAGRVFERVRHAMDNADKDRSVKAWADLIGAN
jgi:hypothetical protein